MGCLSQARNEYESGCLTVALHLTDAIAVPMYTHSRIYSRKKPVIYQWSDNLSHGFGRFSHRFRERTQAFEKTAQRRLRLLNRGRTKAAKGPRQRGRRKMLPDADIAFRLQSGLDVVDVGAIADSAS